MLVFWITNLENNITSIERIKEYCEMPQEVFLDWFKFFHIDFLKLYVRLL